MNQDNVADIRPRKFKKIREDESRRIVELILQEVAETEQTTNCSGGRPLPCITIPKLKDIKAPTKSYECIQLPTNVLLLTVEGSEYLSCYVHPVIPYTVTTEVLDGCTLEKSVTEREKGRFL